MSKITNSASRVRDFFRGRIGAMLLLTLSCFVCFSVISKQFDSVTVNADGETKTFITLRDTPQEIIMQAGYSFDSGDSYTVIEGEDHSQEITILRSFEVTISDAGVVSTVELTEGATVGDALRTAGVALPDEDDNMNYTASDAAYAYMNITIDRVKVDTATTTQSIAYKTVKHETKSLTRGKTRVVTAGVNGEKQVVTKYTWVNGVLVSEEVVKETVTKAAVDEIVDVGTAVETTTTAAPAQQSNTLSTRTSSHSVNATGGQFTDASGRTVSYSKVLTGSGTAYTAEPGAKTSTGRDAEVGVVAVDPDVIPYGTRLYIVSADGKQVYGYALAADTGSALTSGSALVDLFYETESQCLAFGRRDVIVYILA